MIPKVLAQATRRMVVLFTEVGKIARGKENRELSVGRVKMLIGCPSANVKSAVGKNARVQGVLLARIDIWGLSGY